MNWYHVWVGSVGYPRCWCFIEATMMAEAYDRYRAIKDIDDHSSLSASHPHHSWINYSLNNRTSERPPDDSGFYIEYNHDDGRVEYTLR